MKDQEFQRVVQSSRTGRIDAAVSTAFFGGIREDLTGHLDARVALKRIHRGDLHKTFDCIGRSMKTEATAET